MLDVDRHGDQYPPSRPGPKTLIGALIVILAGLAIAFWPQIMATIGIHVAPPGGRQLVKRFYAVAVRAF
jgi:hypothetical protein